jgi:ABC-type uncharacterized transport system permease subunit
MFVYIAILSGHDSITIGDYTYYIIVYVIYNNVHNIDSIFNKENQVIK